MVNIIEHMLRESSPVYYSKLTYLERLEFLSTGFSKVVMSRSPTARQEGLLYIVAVCYSWIKADEIQSDN